MVEKDTSEEREKTLIKGTGLSSFGDNSHVPALNLIQGRRGNIKNLYI